MTMDADTAAIVDRVIRERRTTKVLADAPFPDADARRGGDELAATAGWAPFHRVVARLHQESGLTSIVPWRFHLLDAPSCRALRDALLAREPTPEAPAGSGDADGV